MRLKTWLVVCFILVIGMQLSGMGRGNFHLSSQARSAYVGELASILTSLDNVNSAVNNAPLQAAHAKTAEIENRTAREQLGVCSQRMNDLVAAASEELSGQAALLKDLVGRFHLRRVSVG